MDEDQIRKIVTTGESVDREFKSELHRLQTEDEIVSDIVAMANTNGGVLLLGIEDDGTITGTPERTGSQSEPAKIKATIYTKTVPNIYTRVSILQIESPNTKRSQCSEGTLERLI